MDEQMKKAFHDAFVLASQHEPSHYSYSIRMLTAVLCIITSGMVIGYFIKKANKESDTYIPQFMGLTVKLVIALSLALIYIL